MRALLLLTLTLTLGACAAPPAVTVEAPPATRADLNARLFGATVDLRLDDGTEIRDAEAVLVGPDAVRFVAPGDDFAAVRSVPLVEVAEIVERSRPGGRTGMVGGAVPGLTFLYLLSRRGNGALNGAAGKAGFAATVIGSLVGWRLAQQRSPPTDLMLYRRPG